MKFINIHERLLEMFTKSHVWKLKVGSRRNASEIVGIYGNQYKDRIKKSVYFMLTIFNNGQFKNRWTICICIGSKMIASVLSVLFFLPFRHLFFFLINGDELSFPVLKSTYDTLLLLFITLYTAYFRCLLTNVRRNLNSYPLLTTLVP